MNQHMIVKTMAKYKYFFLLVPVAFRDIFLVTFPTKVLYCSVWDILSNLYCLFPLPSSPIRLYHWTLAIQYPEVYLFPWKIYVFFNWHGISIHFSTQILMFGFRLSWDGCIWIKPCSPALSDDYFYKDKPLLFSTEESFFSFW